MKDEGKEHRSVSRAVQILEYVAANPEGTKMPALVRELDAPRSSVHGLVSGLVACGYLQTRQGAYYLGPAIGKLLSSQRTLDAVAKAAMTKLAEDVGETVLLAIRIGHSLIYIAAVESHHDIRFSATLYERRALYPASSGKCFLAFGTADFRESYISEHIKPAQRSTVRSELEEITRNGYAVNRGQTIADVTAIAVPLKSQDQLIGCIAVAGPTARIHADQLPGIAKHAQSAATGIAKTL